MRSIWKSKDQGRTFQTRKSTKEMWNWKICRSCFDVVKTVKSMGADRLKENCHKKFQIELLPGKE